MTTRTPHRLAERPGLRSEEAPGYDDADLLLQEYADTRSPDVHERIVAACTPLVRRIAAEFAYSGVPPEDLIQVGYIGLLNAVNGFDPGRGAKFATYASYLIRGEIRHYLRDQRDTIRRPRWLNRLSTRIEETINAHVAETGRFPSLEALARELNIEEDGLLEVLRAREVLRTVSIEADEEGADLRVDRDRIRHRTHISFQLPIEDRVMLMEALESLTALQRNVVYYLFYTDLTQMEAAKQIGISQKHVSRVLAAALGKLRGATKAPSPGAL
ncbi:MAG: sigma-70 family RNA polymerase sigma factor [bacterium]|nr:sigma-70 family RNA polymerase sigma factor [bacterium]